IELAAGLDGWVEVLQRQGKDVWRRRLAAARATDPDPLRDRVRGAVARGDRKALEELTALDPGTDLPTPTLMPFAYALEWTQAIEHGQAVLRKAQRRHPGDFWINYNLSQYPRKMNTPQADDAVRYATVAVALRPQSPLAYNNLGNALLDRGRRDEA